MIVSDLLYMAGCCYVVVVIVVLVVNH